jgi:hypothetical protein
MQGEKCLREKERGGDGMVTDQKSLQTQENLGETWRKFTQNTKILQPVSIFKTRIK